MILVCGNFGNSSLSSSGQIIRTTTVYNTLKEVLKEAEVKKINTANGLLSLLRLLLTAPYYFITCNSIVILPAHHGVRIIVPYFVFLNRIFRRKIHYIVIGGWLPEFLLDKPILTKQLQKLSGMYVQTSVMKQNLVNMGFDNVSILTNFRKLPMLKEEDLEYDISQKIKLCTFSRVIKEKGIEDAIQAVRDLNEKYGKTLFVLDIYGTVDSNQTAWFEEIKKDFPEYVKYQGGVPFSQSVNVLKDYFALLFPTYYDGEGFAGTLVDAMAAGLPVVASDWRYNSEFVKEKKTGLLFHTHNVKELEDRIEWLYKNPVDYFNMRKSSLSESQNYQPLEAIKVLSERL